MTRFPDCYTRPRHADTQDALEAMIRDLRTTLDAHEPIGKVQRQSAIAVIHRARRDVERCSTPFDELIKRHGLQDDRWPDHMDLTSWLTNLSMDLIKQGLPEIDTKEIPSKLINAAQLDEGLKLVRELDNCREQLRFER